MELVRGILITDYCEKAKLSAKERLDLFIKVCHAIQHAHQKGIIHRDIKPSNILAEYENFNPMNPAREEALFAMALGLTQAAFLLKREGREADPIFALLERGVLHVGLEIEDQLADLRGLMRRYRDRPMSLAEACLVRLAELHPGGFIFTLDGDFRIYRRHGNKVIPVLMPED